MANIFAIDFIHFACCLNTSATDICALCSFPSLAESCQFLRFDKKKKRKQNTTQNFFSNEKKFYILCGSLTRFFLLLVAHSSHMNDVSELKSNAPNTDEKKKRMNQMQFTFAVCIEEEENGFFFILLFFFSYCCPSSALIFTSLVLLLTWIKKKNKCKQEMHRLETYDMNFIDVSIT